VPAYAPSHIIRYQPTGTVQPKPVLPQSHTYPPRDETNFYIFAGPVTIVNERPAEREEEGRWDKYASLVVGVLNVIGTVIGACVQ
jgi:hypothetical protein